MFRCHYRPPITCNGASASSGSDGAFSLSVSQSSNYTCIASASNYASVTATFSGKGSSFTLAFGPKPAAKCTPGASANVLTCGVLPPATATLRGTVTNAATDQALPHVKVQCWNSALDNISNNGSSRTTTTTDDLGNYVFHNLAVDPYGCVADTDQTLQSTVLAPGKTTTLDIAACESNCPLFKYHQGVVIHHLTVYLIFWLPSGYTFEPNGSSSRFEQLMGQYINDVGGTSFYNVLSQYYDEQGGPVRNVVTLGGSYVDTENYPRAGTQSDPLYDGHISDEVNHVQDLNPSWTIDSEHLFVVFTGYNVQSPRERLRPMAAHLATTTKVISAPTTLQHSTAIWSMPMCLSSTAVWICQRRNRPITIPSLTPSSASFPTSNSRR